MKPINVWLLLLSMTALLSCSSVLRSSKLTALTTDYCKPQQEYPHRETETPGSVSPAADSVLKSKMRQSDYVLAKNTGILPLLSDYISAKDNFDKTIVRQKITDKILLVNAELNAVSAELDCNGERYSQLSDYLSGINNKNLRKATIASISLGALVAIGSSLIDDKNTNVAVNIAGGVASAGLGFLTLNPKGKKAEMTITRSLVANIWNADNSNNAFPASVWRMMNEKSFSNAATISLAESIKKRWLLYSFDGSIDEETATLFLKNGGAFTADDLQTLENMNNELQASIRSLQQNMLSLLSAINSW